MKELKNNNKPIKKKKTAHEKRQFMMKIMGAFMAILMIVGTLMSLFGMLLR